jgi:hypothetical protein
MAFYPVFRAPEAVQAVWTMVTGDEVRLAE